VLGILAEQEGRRFGRRMPAALPPLAALLAGAAAGAAAAAASGMEDGQQEAEESALAAAAGWQEAYAGLLLLERLARQVSNRAPHVLNNVHRTICICKPVLQSLMQTVP